jgi:hypothetical protein
MTKTIFHRSPPPWFEAVSALKPGGRRRLGDGQLVSFNGKGWHLYDFREHQSEVYEPELSLAEKLAVLKAQREAELDATVTAGLPTKGAMSHPKDWPLDARVWFYKAGISNEEIAHLGAFWSPPMGRVVLPYRTVFGQEAWIARHASWKGKHDGSKYLFPAGVKRGGGALFYDSVDPRGFTGLVITEDALSAYRVSRDTDMAAIAAQGTSLDRDAVVWIATSSQLTAAYGGKSIPVFVWLDNDKDKPANYGQIAARKLVEQFGNLGVDVRNIVSERDPKLHEPHEIREALET